MRPIAAAAALLTVLALPCTASGFRVAEAGTPIPDRTMPTADGKQAQLLAPGKVNVLVFARSAQEFSATALRQLAQLERETEGKQVRLVPLFSDADPAADVQAMLRDAGVRATALIDKGDALYGELGVVMTPSAGLVGKDRKLVGFQAFRKVNYLDAMRAQVARALGEIDDAALARALDPAAAPVASGGRAHARISLARRLLAAGDSKGAVASARAAIGIDPASADAHAVLAEALAKAGECAEAQKEAAQAKSLAPSAPVSVACAGR